jgi:hypothetical protein
MKEAKSGRHIGKLATKSFNKCNFEIAGYGFRTPFSIAGLSNRSNSSVISPK